jgi:zinc transporter ZupT
LTGTAALAGTIVGALIGQVYLKEALAFTSGGFLYFALNGLLSELKAVEEFDQLAYCMGSFAIGLYTMSVFV